MNHKHDPNQTEERVLAIFKHEREQYNQARMTPQLIRQRIDEDFSKQNLNYALQRLLAAGWISQPAPGLYEYHEDPRDGGD